ncbi:MAG: SHOCT domain-containing protein [Thaumarchaeota archaeon]|jgi:hypothetical protein|nr:SHOCT domain-containing protein [Nitrososphaerota archaeon]
MDSDKERELRKYEKKYLNRLAGKSDNEDSSITITDKDEKGEKILWKDKNVDLELLTQKMVDFFNTDGFSEIRHEISTDKTEYIVQAKKTGVLRTLSSTRKVITIQIKGNPNDFHVSVGTGEWGKGVAMAAVTGTIGLVGLGFNAVFKEKVWRTIRSSVQSLENTFGKSTETSKTDTPLEILKIRLAKGEITIDEFNELKGML